jgi:hypothetical protein
VSYIEHVLPSSSSLNEKEVLSIWVGGKLKEVGQVFQNPLWQLFSPLNMAPICILSYSWVIFLSSSHINSMCFHTFSFSRRVLLLSSHHILGTYRVNVSKSVVVPHYVQGKFHFKPSICSISSFHFLC